MTILATLTACLLAGYALGCLADAIGDMIADRQVWRARQKRLESRLAVEIAKDLNLR